MNSLRKNIQGSTLVSVIVAFGVLMIGLAMFATALNAALTTTQKSRSFDADFFQAEEAYYAAPVEEGRTLQPGGNTANPIHFKMVPAEDNNSAGFTLYGDARVYEKEIGTDGNKTKFSFYYFTFIP